MLADGPLPAKEISQRLELEGLGLDYANVWRDLDALVKTGLVRKVHNPGEGIQYELDHESAIPLLAQGEIEAVRLASALLKDSALAPLEGLQSILNRTRATEKPEAVDVAIPPGIRPPGEIKQLKKILEAVRRSRVLEIRYQSPVAAAPKTYLLDYKELAWEGNCLYLRAYCPDIDASVDYRRNREFRVDLILDARVSKDTTSRGSLPTFKYRFWAAPNFAPRFARIHSRGRLIQAVYDSDAEDGSRIIESEAAITLHAVRRILGFGQHVRVLDPPDLVEEVHHTIRAMSQQYQ